MRAYPTANARKVTNVSAWDEHVVSQQGFSGGAYASVRAENSQAMFGLNTDPLTDASYLSIDYAWYTNQFFDLRIFEGGVDRGSFGTWAVGDLLEVYYWFDGANWIISYIHNGIPIRSIAVSGGQTLFFDSSFWQLSEFRDLRFGPNVGQPSGTFVASAGINLSTGVLPQLAGAGYNIYLESESIDGDGRWRTHNESFWSTDWLTAFKYRGDADSNFVSGSLELARSNITISVAPLVRGSVANHSNFGGAYTPFLDVGRRLRVRNAIMPRGVAPFGGIGGTWSGSGVTMAGADALINNTDIYNAAFHTDTAVPGAWIRVDMGASVEFDQVRIWNQAGPLGSAVWKVQACQDNITWVDIQTGLWAKNLENIFHFPRRSYRYWRLFLTNTPGAGPWTTEIQFNRDWREIFDGYIDKVSVTGRDSNAINVECRDLGALLIDTDIEVVRQYGSSGGTAVETVMQSILDDNFGAGVITLYTPVSPNWFLHEFSQKLTSVMDAIRTLAKQIGYEVRYLYDANNVLRLTFYAPDRAKLAIDYGLAPTVYTDIDSLDIDEADVRNAWTVEYIDRVTGNKLTAIATSAPSIAQYKRRPAKIAYGYSSNIDSATEAQKMVDAALSDTAFPKALEVVNTPYWPLVDIADVVALVANMEHYDTDQQRAVVSYSHDLRDGDGTTVLTTRGKPGGGYTTWMSMVGGILDGPSLVVMDTPGANPAANHSVSYTGSWDTIQLSINGAAWIVPGASPLVVTPNAAGGATKVYSFRAIKNGQIVTQAVSIEPPAPLPPQALISHLNTEVDDTQWFLQLNAVLGSGGGGTNLLWSVYKKIGFAAETLFDNGNAGSLPYAFTVPRHPRSDTIARLTVTDTLTGLTNTARLTVPSARPEINNTGNPRRPVPHDDGDYATRSPVNTGHSVHPLVIDSRGALINVMHRSPVDTLDVVLDGGTYAKPLGSRISAGKPLIDFSEAIHISKNLGNIPDTASRYASPVPNAMSLMSFLASSGVALGGNTAICSALPGGGWTEQIYSRDGFTGGAYASAIATGPVGQDVMFALNTDPATNAGYLGLDYAIEIHEPTAKIYGYESGANTFNSPYVDGDIVAILYDGSTLRYMKNGTVLRSVYLGPGIKFFFDSSFGTVGAKLVNIQFGPMTPGTLNASNQVVRGLPYSDSAYSVKAQTSDGRALAVTDVYDNTTGQYLSTSFFRSLHTLDSVLDGSTYGRPTFTRLGYADRAGSAIDSGNFIVAGRVVRARTLDDGLYQLRSGSSDGRSLTASDPYFSDTIQYVSAAYQRGYHNFDYVADGGTYLKVVGVNGSGLVNPNSTIGRGSIKGTKTNTQTLANNTLTRIALDAVEFSLGIGMFRSTDFLIVNDAVAAAGCWVIVASLGFAANASGDRYVELRRNGSRIAQHSARACVNAATPTVIPVLTFQFNLAMSDTFEFHGRQDSAGSLAVRLLADETYLAAIHLW